MSEAGERALLVGMPLVHLRAAAEVCDRHGRAVLPAGGPGDLDRIDPGCAVLLMASHAGDDEVSAATWSSRFVGRLPFEPGDPLPALLPATWVSEHGERLASQGPGPELEPEDEDEASVGPQSFLVVEDLRELPVSRWVFANELVGKQARGGRTFFPRVPSIVRVPA